jgi:iron(III) transport system ATP-binding protein
MSAPAVDIQSVTKRFGDVVALDGVTLQIPNGSFSALLGPSGCGKTTLLRLIAGFDVPDAGVIRLGDREVVGAHTSVPPEGRNVGIVPQEGALFPHLSVQDNVGFGLPRAQRRGAQVSELLDLVGLGDLAKRRPHELSGGQQQRVALARCLATKPDVVLLDEPFAALDATLRVDLRAETKRVLREIGATTILVTHDQDEALSMADRVGLMRAGKLVQFATPAQLYADPIDAWAASFVGEANLLPSTNNGEGVRTLVGPVAVRADRRPANSVDGLALVRPEQLTLNHVDASHLGVVGTIVEAIFHGHDHLVTVTVEQHGKAHQLIARAPAQFDPVIGERVTVSVHGSAVLMPNELMPNELMPTESSP